MKRTANVYTEYSPGKNLEDYTVWVERKEGLFYSNDLSIAGTYTTFKEAHERQKEVAENFRSLGYSVKEGSPA